MIHLMICLPPLKTLQSLGLLFCLLTTTLQLLGIVGYLASVSNGYACNVIVADFIGGGGQFLCSFRGGLEDTDMHADMQSDVVYVGTTPTGPPVSYHPHDLLAYVSYCGVVIQNQNVAVHTDASMVEQEFIQAAMQQSIDDMSTPACNEPRSEGNRQASLLSLVVATSCLYWAQ